MKQFIKRLIKKFIYRIRGEILTEKYIQNGMVVGENFKRMIGCDLDYSHCWLIKIGDNVTLAPKVTILAHDASTKMYIGYTKIGLTTIGNNVFVGANSTILPNVRIGDNVIIGANSVVTKDVEDNSVVAGNPAKFICTTGEYIKKSKEKFEQSPKYGSDYTIRNKKINTLMKRQMIDDLEKQMGVGFVE